MQLDIERLLSEPRLLYMQMMLHRGISTKDIAEALGLTPRYINMILSGGLASSTKNLDLIDSAITRISDERGGVTKFCCSASDEYRSMLRREVDVT